MISLEIGYILTPLQKLPKTVGDLGKLLVATCFKTCPKSNKLPNLVTLEASKLKDNAFTVGPFLFLVRAQTHLKRERPI